jgi:hypothetical protein
VKTFMLGAIVSFGLMVGQSGKAPASGGSWWNVVAEKNLSPEEQRLQRFWRDYYDSLRRYYEGIDRIDWVAYYKNQGYNVPAGCPNCQRVPFAPVFVSPSMQWSLGNTAPPPFITAPKR